MSEIIDMAEKIIEKEASKKEEARGYFNAYFALIGLTMTSCDNAEESEKTVRKITSDAAEQLKNLGYKVECEARLLAMTLVCVLQFNLRMRINEEDALKSVNEFFDDRIWDKCISIA